MSVDALRWAFGVPVGNPTRKLLLIALADYADDKNQCWPSQHKLAERIEASVDTVQRHLAELERSEVIKRTSRDREDGGRSTDLYELALTTPHRNLRPPPTAPVHSPPTAPVRPPPTAMVRPTYKEGSPNKIHHNESITSASACERDFDEWYLVYPKHQGRGQALRAYRTARKKACKDTLLAGAERARKRYANADPKFIPMPSTWLNGERWLDEWSAEANLAAIAGKGLGTNDQGYLIADGTGTAPLGSIVMPDGKVLSRW